MHFSFSASQVFMFLQINIVFQLQKVKLSPYTDSAVWHLIVPSFAVVIFFSYLRIAAVAANCKIKKIIKITKTPVQINAAPEVPLKKLLLRCLGAKNDVFFFIMFQDPRISVQMQWNINIYNVWKNITNHAIIVHINSHYKVYH